MSGWQRKRRSVLRTGLAGVTAGVAGCSGILGGENDSDPPEADFSFSYDRETREIEIKHSGGDSIQAEKLVCRTSDGDSVPWHTLGTTTETAENSVSRGSTGRLGESVVNWPTQIEPSETVKVLYAPDDESVVVLDSFEPTTPTPTATPTASPTPTVSPVLREDFDSGTYTETFTDTSDNIVSPEVTSEHAHSGTESLLLRSSPGNQSVNSVTSRSSTARPRSVSVALKKTESQPVNYGITVQIQDVESEAKLKVKDSGYHDAVRLVEKDESSDRVINKSFRPLLEMNTWYSVALGLSKEGPVTGEAGDSSVTVEPTLDWSSRTVRLSLRANAWSNASGPIAVVFDDVQFDQNES